MRRIAPFTIGLLIAIATVTVADSVLPSRPRFASVGVGAPAPTQTGNIAALNITASGTITGASINASTSFTSINYNVDNGAVDGFLQADGTGVSVGTSSNHPLSLYVNDTIRARVLTTGVFDSIDGFSINGTRLPAFCGFDADVDATPSIIQSFGCGGTPGITRNSTGNFTVTHNFALANQYQINCNQRTASGTTPGFVSIQSESSNAATLRTYAHDGNASDGLQNIQCVIVRFNF